MVILLLSLALMFLLVMILIILLSGPDSGLKLLGHLMFGSGIALLGGAVYVYTRGAGFFNIYTMSGGLFLFLGALLRIAGDMMNENFMVGRISRKVERLENRV